MAGVGGDRPDRLLVGIERERVEAEVLAPELLLEGRPERLRLSAQPGRALPLVECLEDLHHAHPRVEDVALELAKGLRCVDLTAVWVDHRVARVLPAHVLVPLRGTRPILLEAVPIEIAVAVDPFEAAERCRPVLAQQLEVAEPLPGFVQGDHIEGRGVGGAVIGRVRDQVEAGELSGAHLVWVLPGLGVATVVRLGRLELRQLLQRAAREARIDDHVLQARDQRAAAEDRDEPRHAGRGEPDVRGEVVVKQPERPMSSTDCR